MEKLSYPLPPNFQSFFNDLEVPSREGRMNSCETRKECTMLHIAPWIGIVLVLVFLALCEGARRLWNATVGFVKPSWIIPSPYEMLDEWWFRRKLRKIPRRR
jgi:hypothetical protein